MVDTRIKELNADMIHYCDKVLSILKDWEASNDTPPGRIILECLWLKQEVKAGRLAYPDAYEHITSIRHTYVAEDMLENHYKEGIKRYFGRIIDLSNNKLLNKPAFYPFTSRMITALIYLLKNPGRELSEYESGMIAELVKLNELLSHEQIDLPLNGYLPDYPNFRKVYRMTKSSIDDLPNGKYLIKTIANLIFEGVRPDSWLTPENADQETKALVERKYEVEEI